MPNALKGKEMIVKGVTADLTDHLYWKAQTLVTYNFDLKAWEIKQNVFLCLK